MKYTYWLIWASIMTVHFWTYDPYMQKWTAMIRWWWSTVIWASMCISLEKTVQFWSFGRPSALDLISQPHGISDKVYLIPYNTGFEVLTNRASNVFGSWCGLSTVSSFKSKKSASYSPSLPDENPISSNFRLFSFPFEKWNSRSSISSIWRGVNVILSFSWSYSKSCGYDDVIKYESWLVSIPMYWQLW